MSTRLKILVLHFRCASDHISQAATDVMLMLDRVLVFNTSDTPTAVTLLKIIKFAPLAGTHDTACSSATVHSLLLAHNDNDCHLSEMP